MQTSRRLPFALVSLAATALLTLACASSLAQAAPASPADSVHVNVNTPYRLSTQEQFDIEHSYQLSNDQILIVRIQGQQVLGRLSNKNSIIPRQEVEIYPQGPGKFVTQRGTAFSFTNSGEYVVIDDAQLLPGLRMPDGSRSAGTADGSASIRLVSR